jgi:TorA maturation chaperone TorD
VEYLYHEPDDHVGIEFSFLAHLARLGLQAIEAKDTKKIKNLTKAQREFVRTHPARWVHQWYSNVETNAHTDFYLGMARLAKGVIGTLEATLEGSALMEVNDKAMQVG